MTKYEQYEQIDSDLHKERRKEDRRKLTDIVIALFYKNYDAALDAARHYVPHRQRFDRRKKEMVDDETSIMTAADKLVAKAREIKDTAFGMTLKEAMQYVVQQGAHIEIDAALFQEIALCGNAFRAVKKGRTQKVINYINTSEFKEKHREDRVKLKMVRIVKGTDTDDDREAADDLPHTTQSTNDNDNPWGEDK